MADERYNWDNIKPQVEAKNYSVALEMVDRQLAIEHSPFLITLKAVIMRAMEEKDAVRPGSQIS